MAICASGCDGGICAASESVLEDADGDCVVDTSDNCISVENPGATYNPEQFDGDEDGIGAPCDSNDTDDTTAGVSLIKEMSFNAGGTYVFAGGCENFSAVELAQNQTAAHVIDASGKAYQGTAEISSDGSLITVLFSDATTVCALELDALTADAVLSCQSDGSDEPCRSIGAREAVQLWSDGVMPFGADSADESATSL